MLGRQLGLTISTATTVLIPVEPSPSLCRPTHRSERLGQLGPRGGASCPKHTATLFWATNGAPSPEPEPDV